MSDLRIGLLPTSPGQQTRVLRLDAPARRNALSPATVEHLLAVLAEEPEEVLVLGSATTGIFCAGADLSVPDAERAALSDQLYACYELMVTRPGPVIAVVEGAAVGGGAQVSAAADLRIGSPAARWRWVGPGHGLAVGGWVLPELLGRSRALDLTLTSRWLGAEEAATAGFARVVDDPWAELAGVLETLAGARPEALARLKQITSHGSLLERLRMERAENFAAWTGAV